MAALLVYVNACLRAILVLYASMWLSVPPPSCWSYRGQHHRGMREYGRGMGRVSNSAHYERCELEVRKVPRNLNNITQLNNHFSRFGNIVNLQVRAGVSGVF